MQLTSNFPDSQKLPRFLKLPRFQTISHLPSNCPSISNIPCNFLEISINFRYFHQPQISLPANFQQPPNNLPATSQQPPRNFQVTTVLPCNFPAESELPSGFSVAIQHLKLALSKENQRPYRSSAACHVGAAVLAQVARSG